MVVALKEAVGTDLMQEREQRFLRRALARWRRNPNLELLGNLEVPRLPIVSFRIRHPARHLHHELVVAMLNDLFGIQARAAARAPARTDRLLGIDPDRSPALSDLSGRGWAGIKPGWVRLSFSYFLDDQVAGFLVEAVDLLATSGHRLLGDYRFDPRSGHWRHRDAPPDPVLSLPDLLDGRPGPGTVTPGDGLAGQLERVRALLEAAEPAAPEAGPSWLPTKLERLRDFHLPATAWSRPPAGGR